MIADPASYAAWLEAQLSALATVPLPRRLFRAPGRHAVLDHALAAAVPRPGRVLEFGVYKGQSLRRMALRAPKRTFAGFDSFEGFPDDGRPDWQLDFSVIGLPEMPSNVTLHKGWFSDTLPAWLDANPGPLAMIHIDCDLYSSTRDVLAALAAHDLLTEGLVIACDEAINYGEFPFNELLALHETLTPLNLDLEPLAIHRHVRSLADTLALLETGEHPDWRTDQANGYRQQAAFRICRRGAAPKPAAPETVARLSKAAAARAALAHP